MKNEYYIEHCPGLPGGPKQIIRPFGGQINLATTFDVDYFVCRAFADRAAKVNVKVLKAQFKGPKLKLISYNYVYVRPSVEPSSMPYSYFGPLRRVLAFKRVDQNEF